MDPVPAAQRAIAHVAARSSGGPVDPDLRVTLNFHPDRLVSMGGLLVLEAMGRDGRYRSQFETGTSNGGLTAYPGGGSPRPSWAGIRTTAARGTSGWGPRSRSAGS